MRKSFSIGSVLALIFFLAIFLFYFSTSTVEFQLGRTERPEFERGEQVWLTEEKSLSSLNADGKEFPCRFLDYGESENTIVVQITFFRRFGTYPLEIYAIRKNGSRYALYERFY